MSNDTYLSTSAMPSKPLLAAFGPSTSAPTFEMDIFTVSSLLVSSCIPATNLIRLGACSPSHSVPEFTPSFTASPTAPMRTVKVGRAINAQNTNVGLALFDWGSKSPYPTRINQSVLHLRLQRSIVPIVICAV